MSTCQIQSWLLGSIIYEDQEQNTFYVKVNLLLLGLRRCMWCLQGESAQKMLLLFTPDHFYHSRILKEYLTTA